jgi:hypothetical protein
MSSRPADGPSGWVSFAAVMLFLAGSLGFFYGLGAVLNDEVITVQGRGVIVWDFTAWGWVHMILGAIMVLTSLGLLTGRGWARVMGVIFATLHAIAQVGLITVHPLWSILLVALDVIVIYQLTARWVPASIMD